MKDKPPYKPQSLFQRIIEEHDTWLFRQGYHERFLGNTDKPGRLLNDLRDLFGKAVTQTLWTYRIEEFDIGTRGVFGPGKDPVDFQLHYKYDPNRVRLDLSSLSARLEDESIVYPIHDNIRRELPPATLVHHQLTTILNTKLLQELREQKHLNRQAKRHR